MKTGCIFKPDDRDYIYSPPGSSQIKFPESYQLPKIKIKDQGDIFSCVACSIAIIKEYQERFEHNDWGNDYEFSVGWIYGHREANQWLGLGMYPREALSNLIKYGNVLNKYFPENKEYHDLIPYVKQREKDCIKYGKPFKCSAYASVKSLNDVKKSLYLYHSPVMIIYEVYKDFYELQQPYKANAAKFVNEETHAMTIIGWTKIDNKDFYVIQNSWGSEWGNNGLCYIDPNDPKILDIYTVTDIINTKKR